MNAIKANSHFPHQTSIEAYGAGGFRFANMSHRGSLLCVPSGILAWTVPSAKDIDVAALERVLMESNAIDLLVIGSGTILWTMPEALRWRMHDKSLRVEIMPTGPAVRTYNVLLDEGRRVAAGLIAVP